MLGAGGDRRQGKRKSEWGGGRGMEEERGRSKKKKKALTGVEPVISCLLDRRFNQLSHRAKLMQGSIRMVYKIKTKFKCLTFAGHHSDLCHLVLVLTSCWTTL